MKLYHYYHCLFHHYFKNSICKFKAQLWRTQSALFSMRNWCCQLRLKFLIVTWHYGVHYLTVVWLSQMKRVLICLLMNCNKLQNKSGSKNIMLLLNMWRLITMFYIKNYAYFSCSRHTKWGSQMFIIDYSRIYHIRHIWNKTIDYKIHKIDFCKVFLTLISYEQFSILKSQQQ